VQYPHAIDISMTIHMQGGQNTSNNFFKKKEKRKEKRSLLKENIVSLMFKGDGTDAQ